MVHVEFAVYISFIDVAESYTNRTIWLGLAWSGLASYGLIRLGLAWAGLTLLWSGQPIGKNASTGWPLY